MTARIVGGAVGHPSRLGEPARRHPPSCWPIVHACCFKSPRCSACVRRRLVGAGDTHAYCGRAVGRLCTPAASNPRGARPAFDGGWWVLGIRTPQRAVRPGIDLESAAALGQHRARWPCSIAAAARLAHAKSRPTRDRFGIGCGARPASSSMAVFDSGGGTAKHLTDPGASRLTINVVEFRSCWLPMSSGHLHQYGRKALDRSRRQPADDQRSGVPVLLAAHVVRSSPPVPAPPPGTTSPGTVRRRMRSWPAAATVSPPAVRRTEPSTTSRDNITRDSSPPDALLASGSHCQSPGCATTAGVQRCTSRVPRSVEMPHTARRVLTAKINVCKRPSRRCSEVYLAGPEKRGDAAHGPTSFDRENQCVQARARVVTVGRERQA